MPKLNKKQAATVGKAEAVAGGYLLPEGRYAARLLAVTENEGREYPYWTWEFGDLHDEDGAKQPGKQWNNTSLSPKSAGFLKATFEAMGYTVDSDTDEMIGEWCVLYLVQEPITQGANAGQLRNSVSRVAEFVESDWDFDPEESNKGKKSKANDDDEF